jgi:hypothetical protein
VPKPFEAPVAPLGLEAIAHDARSLTRSTARKRRVFLGLPHNGTIATDSMSSVMTASLGTYDVGIGAAASSLLCYNFNRLWADALNVSPRPDFFAMHHSDIGAPDGWLDVLIEILEAKRADMVSAVVPIKTGHGNTSTGVLDVDGSRRRRLTVREVATLPPVFDAKAAGALSGVKNPVLIVNTGLWVCRFAGLSGIEELHFHTGDSIRADGPGGTFRAHCTPEDWMWSMDFASRGLKVLATTRVPVRHYGHTAFAIGFGPPWGTNQPGEWEPV